MRPPQQAEVPWGNGQPFSDPFDVKSVETDKGINPPSLKSVFEFPPADTEDESPPIEREATPPLPLANILNLSQKAKDRRTGEALEQISKPGPTTFG